MAFILRTLGLLMAVIFLGLAAYGVRTGSVRGHGRYERQSIEISAVSTPGLFWAMISLFAVIGIGFAILALKKYPKEVDDI